MDLVDDAGPTAERLAHAQGFYTIAGRSRRARRFTFLDDTLGRIWMRQSISTAEYSSLRRYALHWLAGGLQGHLGSVDLNRVLAFDPHAMTGLAKTEAQVNHREIYYAARKTIGTRPAIVADQVACYDSTLTHVGRMLGFRSEAKGRARVIEILSDAGYRLEQFFDELARRN